MTQYEEDLLIEIERLKDENAELRSLLEEKREEFQPLTWKQRGVPVL
jgi:hypothetical protein